MCGMLPMREAVDCVLQRNVVTYAMTMIAVSLNLILVFQSFSIVILRYCPLKLSTNFE